ncbi:prestin isoform X2 [Patella vulgata]|uniref:prestin isoform X2 n=1 Tax=Patella vulgata TaxID=6465 RepID=UPI00218067C4|nr:prestin isoform X2 [Patella vulgata]
MSLKNFGILPGVKNRMKDAEDGEIRNALINEERVVVERPVYTQLEFDKGFTSIHRPVKTPKVWAKKKVSKFECSGKCIGKFITQVFPFLSILKGYSIRSDLPADIIAGLTVGIMHIPQGMAYGQLSTLPPVFGLYVSFFPVIIYFFFGSSRHVSVGTFAVVSLMVGTVVDKGVASQGLSLDVNPNKTGNGTAADTAVDDVLLQTQLAFAMAVTFAVGCIQLLMGFVRLGFVTVYLSDPLISGFTTGAACHVFTSQIKHIFGVVINRYNGPFKLIFSYRDFFMNIPSTNIAAIVGSAICILILVLVKELINNNPRIKPKLKMPVPVELIVVVIGTLVSEFTNLNKLFEVKIVGDVPVGFPVPALNQFRFLPDVISDAVAIAIVAFVISVSMAKILAKKHDYEIDPNQELVAYGACNVVGSFFSSFCTAASLSRSLVQEGVGGKTQICGMVSSCLLVVVLLVIGPYFKSLPNFVLASIIIVALKGMFKQFLDLKRLWSISIIDFAVWSVSFLATVLLDVDYGLMAGVGFALLTVIARSQRPYTCVLGQVDGTDIYRDVSVYEAVHEIEGIKIFRIDAALFFANAEHFKNQIYKLTVDPKIVKKIRRKRDKIQKKIEKQEQIQNGSSETKVAVEATPETSDTADLDLNLNGYKSQDNVHSIIIDCSTMSYVDSVGVKVLGQIINEYKTIDIQVYLAQCKAGIREMFEKTDFYTTMYKEWLFVSIHDAVLACRKLNNNSSFEKKLSALTLQEKE